MAKRLKYKKLSLFGSVLLACQLASPAYAETEEYPPSSVGEKIIFDPSKCTTPSDGMTYVAIGKTVLHHPSHKIYDVSNASSDNQETPNVAPVPSDPKGCPGNPMQKLGAGFILKGFPGLLEDNPDKTFAVRVSYDTDSKELYDYTFNNEKFFDLVCKNQFHTEDNSIPRLKGCIAAHPNSPTEINIVYQATDYLTPTGRKFIVACHSSEFRAAQGCKVTYKLSSNIRIGYGFRNEIPIAKIIEFDKALRRQIEAEEINNYPWATPSTNTK